MDDDVGLGILVILIIVVIFAGGFFAGNNAGEDYVADLWCISLEYDSGEYDSGMDNVVCKHVEIMEGE